MAWRPVLAAAAALTVLLAVTSDEYGFHRDELYFRMLRPAWGYVDQPPLTPLWGRFAAHISGDVWVMRLPAVLAAAGSVLVLVAITRELGGGRGAQTLCAWAYAFASLPLLFGHVLLTASLDLVVWPLTCLFVIRASLRNRPQWWIAAGVTIGASTANKLLIGLLVIALLAGILVTGPSLLRRRMLFLGAVAAVVLASPALVYQATHSWPQLSMGRALSVKNAADVRVAMWPFLALGLGPPLVPIWVAGLVTLIRRPAWRPVRFVAAAFGFLLLETFIGGGQSYYPTELLAVLFAAGCVPTAEFLATRRRWRRTAIALIGVNAVVSSLIALPLLPLSVLGSTPVPGINQLAADQVGWPEYVGQIAGAYRSIPAAQRVRTAVITSNYGEAGAITRYGAELGLPRPYSGQNALYSQARPPAGTENAVLVGGQLSRVRHLFANCTIITTLNNESDVDNEEEGEPVAICVRPVGDWSRIWPEFRHLD